MFGPISGGHFNPVVSFVDAAFGGLRWGEAAAYLPAQVAGCVSGAVVANLMFSMAAVSISSKHRASGGHFFSEIVATLGLLLVIFALARTGRGRMAAAAVGAYIGAAYFFTSSTSFANPAITVGRMFSDTFAGIAPSSAPSYIGAQVVGGFVAIGAIKVLYPDISPAEAAEVVVPHPSPDGAADQSTANPDRPVANRSSPPIEPATHRGGTMHVVTIGGSDAGISAALRARELDPSAEVTVVVADAYPNFSICGIPYYISGEVARWQSLAHRTYSDLEAAGLQLRTDTRATRIDVDEHQVWLRHPDGSEEPLAYDRLVVGTGAVPVRPADRRPGWAGGGWRGRRRAPPAHNG